MANNDLKIWQNHLLLKPFHMLDAKFYLVLRPISHRNPAMPFDPSANLNLKEGAVPPFFACQKNQKRVFTVTGNGKLHVNKYS